MPALQSCIIEPIWEQFSALLPEREVEHHLGCHRPRIPDRTVFEKLVEVLVFGCSYWRIADESCSATTLRRRRDEWIAGGLMKELRQMALSAYARTIGLELSDVAVDGCITKAPCGGGQGTLFSPLPASGRQRNRTARAVGRALCQTGCSKSAVTLHRGFFIALRFTCKSAQKESRRADMRTAYPCSSYE